MLTRHETGAQRPITYHRPAATDADRLFMTGYTSSSTLLENKVSCCLIVGHPTHTRVLVVLLQSSCVYMLKIIL